MNEMRTLIENYWINRSTDKELYNKTKRELTKYRKFVQEQLGWNLIANERIIKMEKVPAYAESFMGIAEFQDIKDYCILCALLLFLEDKEDNEQFLLSELVDVIEAQLSESMEIDWTKYVQRKSLVRVLQFAEKKGMLAVYEGNSDNLSSGMDQEVLYENTGISRYFATSFEYDISEFTSYKDFETVQLKEVMTDKGHYRINRVYRQLVTAPAMYWEDPNDMDSVYVRNQRQWVQKNLDDNLGGSLHLHKNAIFFVMEEDNCFGEKHPKDAMLPELVLILCAQIRQKVLDGSLIKDYKECITMDRISFQKIVEECKLKYNAAWSKEYRDMSIEKMCGEVIAYMENWMLLSCLEEIIIYPAAGKFIGFYPKEFQLKEGK